MLNLFYKIIDRTLVIAGALIFSQAPVFMQQYNQLLQGHVEELNIQVEAIRTNALQVNKSIDHYVQKFLDSSDIDFRLQGEVMDETIFRFDNLNEGLRNFHNASFWQRPFVFMKYFNLKIAVSTFKNYKVNIPLTIEGLIYGLMGMVIGYGVFLLLKQFFKLLCKPFKKQPLEIKANESE